ncbi:MAG TPA: ABC transporter permease, partial [Flavobacteriaceae bacterium]|nr:ABC transporter permease [Flavobacteriaceae bacterium]
LRVLKESFNFAINALKNNKLRTFLSLLGVTIGIFSIIAVLASVDSLKSEIEDSISGLDNSTIFLCRFSFGPTDVPRWKWEQYPDVTYEEHMLLKKMMPNMKGISFQLNVQNESVKFEDKSIENVEMNGVTEQQTEIENMKIAHGRFFNESESNSGAAVIVI